MGTRLLEMLRESVGDHPLVGDIRGRGLFAAIELVSDRETLAGFQGGSQLPDRLRLAAMDEGMLCYPSGFWLNQSFVPHIMFAPPMIVEEKHLRAAAEKVRLVIDRVLGRA